MLLYKVIYHINAIIKKYILKLIYGNRIIIGKKVTFRKMFNVMIDKCAILKIGNGCFFNNNCSLNVLKGIEIGDNCIFGENVKIYDHNHKFKDKQQLIKEQGYSVGNVKIGNNCWICSNVVILKGVEIGDNCVIGAGCIVNKNVENDSLVKYSENIKIEKVI